jgi:Ser-tRNA(Ala) deacylase AlaX
VLPNHLQRHHGISSKLYTAILRRYEHLPVAQEDSNIVPHPNDSRVLPFLAVPVRGFGCPHCICLTVNWGEYRKHISRTHSLENIIVHRKDVSCFLQRWVLHRKTGQYWRVDHTQANSVESIEAEHEEEQRDDKQSIRLEEEQEEEEGCCDPDLAELKKRSIGLLMKPMRTCVSQTSYCMTRIRAGLVSAGGRVGSYADR